MRVVASETTKAIMAELEGGLFCILVNESRDVSYKEQIALFIRFVRKDGSVVEGILEIVHVMDTTTITLKTKICSLLAKHNLSLSMVRGQSYDGASNIQASVDTCGHFKKNQIDVAWAFNFVTSTQNVVGASCKRQDLLREKRAAKIKEALDNGDHKNGRGLNQEVGLRRPEIVEKEAKKLEKRAIAKVLLDSLQTFDFIFVAHPMQHVLGVTNELSSALQRKDQDIANVMALVKLAKLQLQTMRDEG